MEYSAEVRRRFAAALLGQPDAAGGSSPVWTGEAEDRTLGVWVRARIRVFEGRIAAAAFDVYGCPDTIAAARYAEERVRGIGLDELDGLDAREVARTLGIPTEKLGKLLRLEDAVLTALEKARAEAHKESKNGDITD